jgi:hypothetical protein
MATDWQDARLDRLTKRVDRIEQERWEERQRFFNRTMYGLLAVIWLMVIANVAISISKGAH